jgi:hypothetical protein
VRQTEALYCPPAVTARDAFGNTQAYTTADDAVTMLIEGVVPTCKV